MYTADIEKSANLSVTDNTDVEGDVLQVTGGQQSIRKHGYKLVRAVYPKMKMQNDLLISQGWRQK